MWTAPSGCGRRPARIGLTLAAGIPSAHSWATDAHKWLNVPYDSGIVFAADPQHLKASMSSRAAYLIAGETREPSHYTPELSRRARGVEVWAALRSLGRSGLADLIERNCRYARRFAEGLKSAGYEVLNEVVLNQVLVSFGSAERTRAGGRQGPGGRHLLVRRHRMAGPCRHAHQRLLVGDDRGGCRAQPAGHHSAGGRLSRRHDLQSLRRS